MAMKSVSTTLAMEASRKSFVLVMSVRTMPLGKEAEMSAVTLSISLMISLAFEPEVCAVMQLAPGCPLVSLNMA